MGFHSTDENKEVLKKFTKLWNGIKNKIETINGGKKVNMIKISWKLKFDTDNKLPLNKQLKLHMLTILVRYVFEEGDRLYLQLYLDDCFYRL